MDSLVSMSVDLHIFFVFLTLALAFVNLFIVKKCSDYVNMTKKVELFTPMYYLSLSVVIFTGLVVLAVFHFHFIHTVYMMILTSVIIIIGAFKAYGLFKLTREKDINSQIIFREFAAKKYIVDILLLIFTIGFAFSFTK